MTASGSAALAAISQARLMAHVERFGRTTKHAGTPSELASFRDLATAMAALGFATELLSHPAYISLPGAATLRAGDEAIACITHSFAVSTPPAGLQGPVTYIGEGAPADFAAHEVTGRIVVVEGVASPAVTARARASGAIGQIHISPHEHLHEMCLSPVWGSPTADSLPLLPRTAVVSIARADGDRLLARVRAAPTEALIHASVDTGWRSIPLLVAHCDAPGADGAAPFVLLSGHHDTWHVGATDNGSANAAMLELARVAAGVRAHWRRGLRVCFWSGHSQGRYAGSAWYADEHWDELSRWCVAHVNVDSLGGCGATVVSESAATADLADLAARAVLAETGERHAGGRPGRSADMSFGGIGIAAMFGIVSQQPAAPAGWRPPLGWWWHTPADTTDKIDPVLLLRDARLVWRALDELLLGERLPLAPGRAASALAHELATVAARLGGRLDVTPLVALADACAAAIVAAEASLDILASAKADALLLTLSRQLVRLEQAGNDPHVPEPALPQPAWPLLAPLRALADAPTDAEWATLATSARRSRNRVLHLLRQLAATTAGLERS